MSYITMDGSNNVSNILVLGGSDKIAANPHLKWETTTTRDFGIDYGFFNERLSGAIDLYWNTTKDLIVLQTLPMRYAAQYQNIGSTDSKGVEFSVKGVILEKQSKNLSYNLTIDANISYSKLKVIDLGGVDTLYAQTACFGSSENLTPAEFLLTVGGTVGNVYGYVTDGYYTASDFNAYIPAQDKWNLKPDVVVYSDGSAGDGGGAFLTNPIRPGSIKFKDISGPNGVPDGKIDSYDKVVLGNTVPKLTGGFNLNFNIGGDKWGRIDLGANFTFSIGNKVLNLNRMEYTTMTDKSKMRNLISAINHSERYSLFTEDGVYIPALQSKPLTGDAYVAFANTLDNEYNGGKKMANPGMSHYVITDQCVEDGSFLRLNQLTLGYSFPKEWMVKSKVIQNIRLYVQGTNIFCATKYTGMDPEVDTRSSKNPLTPGVDFSAYPKSRGINVGLNIQF